MMGLTITAAQARRTFPGIPPSVFYAIAPPSDRGRVMTFGAAFDAARRHAQREAQEAKAALAAAGCEADAEEARAAAALPAVAYLAEVIERETGALADSLRARSASPRALSTVERIAAVNARQISRARARIERGADHGKA